jgi:hypothetical protein
MDEITSIGMCIGCDRRAVLSDRVCNKCLSDPKRGRRWAEVVDRCRKDEEYMKSMTKDAKSRDTRRFFEVMFSKS